MQLEWQYSSWTNQSWTINSRKYSVVLSFSSAGMLTRFIFSNMNHVPMVFNIQSIHFILGVMSWGNASTQHG
jgi:hypothetical protein